MIKKIFFIFGTILLFSLMGVVSYAVLYSNEENARQAHQNLYNSIDCNNLNIIITPETGANSWVCDVNDNCNIAYTFSFNHMNQLYAVNSISATYEMKRQTPMPNWNTVRNTIRPELEQWASMICTSSKQHINKYYEFEI